MIEVKRTPKLVQRIKEQIQWQTKMGYTHGVEANTKWLETGLGIPVHGVPPIFNSVIDINTPICRGFSSKTGKVHYLKQETAQ